MPVAIRPFERRDRDQLTALINLHVAAVIPGVVLSVNTVLGQLEREPQENIRSVGRRATMPGRRTQRRDRRRRIAAPLPQRRGRERELPRHR
jgi:hypothetical protein